MEEEVDHILLTKQKNKKVNKNGKLIVNYSSVWDL